MPIKDWGDRQIVDLNWQGPKMFSLNRTPSTVPDYRGVYLLASRRLLYDYPRGRSSLAYIGSGLVADRLPAHVDRNPRVRTTLDNEGTMWFWYARVPQGMQGCVEQVMFDKFVEKHGSNPILNMVRPPCDLEWRNMTVRHDGLSFPYDFSRSKF
jgi:hypothetical protein